MAALWNRAGHYIFALWFINQVLNKAVLEMLKDKSCGNSSKQKRHMAT